jgi:4-hydroxy-tetrahydrodipicolinate reductase
MKLNIGIAGISGRIGKRLVEEINKDSNSSIACGLVSKNSQYKAAGIAVGNTCGKADIWVDFSTPDAFEAVLRHCVENNTPLVTGTTGLSKKHFIEIENASQQIAIIWASNFSISINLIQQFLSQYSHLYPSQVDITETHHIHKSDKPSGTAITLARSIKPHAILKTVDENKFQLDDINIESIREAEIAGIHSINIENNAETIKISHMAKTPQIFAQGAVNVAKWLCKQDKGYYTMNDYIESLS